MKGYFKRILCFLGAMAFLAGAGCSKQGSDSKNDIRQSSVVSTEQVTQEPATKGLPNGDPTQDVGSIYEAPVDIGAMQVKNKDIYAYIHIPNTNIDYPILQSASDDNYYLKHNEKKEYTYKGAIFTQSANLKDFLDPVTVVYGHNTDKGDMFSELLYFQDKKFFEENPYFYIYLPYHIYVYQIFSAHTYDKRHILNSYDFSQKEVILDFQKTLLHPNTLTVQTRDVYLDELSNILVLSTCSVAKSNSPTRFLVNGVLVKDVITEQVQ